MSATVTSTESFTVTAPSSSSTVISSQGSGGSSFLGSKPSTVLFFIALSVGVIIAVLFIFFTFRYLVRSRFGLYIPAPQYARNPFYIGPTGRASMNGIVPYFENDTTLYFMGNNRSVVRGRRAAERNYSRKRKLTAEEVDDLFPLKTYANWLNGGREELINRNEGILVYGEDEINDDTPRATQGENINENGNDRTSSEDEITTKSASAANEVDLGEAKKSDLTCEVIELVETSKSTGTSNVEVEGSDSIQPIKTTNAVIDATNDPHFTSGVCAICLDNLENEDDVRGLICGHVFHSECVDPWLINRRGCCPMCKRDYYMRDSQGRSTNGNRAQGSRDLDSIFDNSGSDNLELFFPRSTRFKAQTLLACLLLVRSGQYNPVDEQGTANTSPEEDNNNPDSNSPATPAPRVPTLPLPGTQPITITTTEAESSQRMTPDDYSSPPMPDMSLLSASIKEIVDERPFHPSDLINIDKYAYKMSFLMCKWYMKPVWRIMGISKLDIYYHYVVLYYERKRAIRLNRGDVEGDAVLDSAVDDVDDNGPTADEAGITESQRRERNVTPGWAFVDLRYH
ncbi:hypothetical protein CANARDRAFT_26306 [[Candida] arabinofermentans NRRL YB-2248]|uniref:RING-type domain-containing protein n=1 Tax=[Candida] arabinofermentans NRRL YB-2248 TaxID=983967 RepID=A0A1E4T919_9ASCO|nr:hypothetical protein CANARDRAFT_26306 [[Candida] arabinofermentans NRRL YB-2248]